MKVPEEYMFTCLNKSLFGVDCTGCGGQRAALLLLQGNFKEAFFMYPAIYSLMALFIFLLFNLFVKFKYDHSVKLGLIIFNALIIAASYIIKMTYLLY